MEEETKIVPPPEEKTEISPPPEEETEAAPRPEASAAGPAARSPPVRACGRGGAAPDRPSPPVKERTGNSALGALGAFAGALHRRAAVCARPRVSFDPVGLALLSDRFLRRQGLRPCRAADAAWSAR